MRTLSTCRHYEPGLSIQARLFECTIEIDCSNRDALHKILIDVVQQTRPSINLLDVVRDRKPLDERCCDVWNEEIVTLDNDVVRAEM